MSEMTPAHLRQAQSAKWSLLHRRQLSAGLAGGTRSRKAVGDFGLTRRIQGYSNSPDTEIDLVAVNEDEHRIRFGSCKRSATELVAGATALDGHVERFLQAFPRYRDWTLEKAAIAPSISAELRRELQTRGHIPQSIDDLLDGIAS